MTVCKCDKCGNIVPLANKVEITVDLTVQLHPYISCVDLCPECAKDVYKLAFGRELPK
jgi:hypothetical protein